LGYSQLALIVFPLRAAEIEEKGRVLSKSTASVKI
jgi:hypothetical protein